MKKLHLTYIAVALGALLFTSCSYQNYTAAETQFSPLTGDMYAANTSWNADHYNVVSVKTANPITPQTPVRQVPVYSSIIMTSH